MTREISEAVKAQVLRSFTNREADLAEQNVNQAVSWRFNDGIILFPEGRCPWCRAAIRNKEIWRVVDRQLMGQWRVVSGRLRPVRPVSHPHVNGINICMGNADDAASALFLHMNPSSCYWNWGFVGHNSPNDGWRKPREQFGQWLVEQWDHDCPGHQHTSMADCQLVACPARNWSGSTPGCECGCLCNPEVNKPCPCTHEECRCEKAPRRVSGGARVVRGPVVQEEASCANCGEPFEDGRERSACCTNWCLPCHDGLDQNDDEDEGDEEGDEDELLDEDESDPELEYDAEEPPEDPGF